MIDRRELLKRTGLAALAAALPSMEPRWNPAGYLRNVVETVRVTAA
jgi:hypothetical protein